MTAIKIDSLTKWFGEDVLAVDGLHLEVEDREVFGFLGPNGAGKSTTINVILGFLTPSSGSVEVLGKYVSRTAVAICAVLVSTLAALAIGVGVYDGMPDVGRFVTFALVTALFVSSMTAMFVACSTLTSRRSRAMFGDIGLYFLLGPFWLGFLPVVSLNALVTTVADLFGATLSETTMGYVQMASPTTAYLSGLEPVYDGIVDGGEYPRAAQNYASNGDELYTENWYNYVVMTAWGALALALSYARFRVAELG